MTQHMLKELNICKIAANYSYAINVSIFVIAPTLKLVLVDMNQIIIYVHLSVIKFKLARFYSFLA